MWEFDFSSVERKIRSFSIPNQKKIESEINQLQKSAFFQRIKPLDLQDVHPIPPTKFADPACSIEADDLDPMPKIKFFPYDYNTSSPTILNVILAGGLGSRLGLGPKALLHFMGKTLLEHLIDKVDGPVAVMCSKENITAIRALKTSKKFYTFLQSEYIAFEQAGVPLFDGEALVHLPSGNGEVIFDLAGQDFFGLEFDHISICNIDNPYWNPEDLALIDGHEKNEREVSIAVTKAKGRKMGVPSLQKPYIVEYHRAKQSSEFGNFGAYLLSKKFCEKMLREPMPNLYPVLKNYHQKNIFKLESFIFDCFASASKVGFSYYDASQYYRPIKEKKDLTPGKVWEKS